MVLYLHISHIIHYFVSIYDSLQLFTCMCNNVYYFGCEYQETKQDIETALNVLWGFACLGVFLMGRYGRQVLEQMLWVLKFVAIDNCTSKKTKVNPVLFFERERWEKGQVSY